MAPLWSPTRQRVEATNLDRFRRTVSAETGLPLESYEDLHAWSVTQPAAFWRAAWEHLGIIGRAGPITLAPGEELRDTRFFPDAELNFAENLLAGAPDDPVIFFAGESGARRTLTRADLANQVAGLAAAMRAEGVGPGDRVAAWMPNIPETYAIMLAAASIGAVFSSTSPDFGANGVVDRFGQIEPCLLFATDGYRYGGAVHDCTHRLAEIRSRLPTLERVVVISFEPPDDPLPLDAIPDAIGLDDWLAPVGRPELVFPPLPFDHPLYILYSSGTTGAPKCIVHRAGGILVKHAVEHRLHCDVHPGDRVFYFTTAGWMMWNWLASALGAGAAIVVYDGSPFHPDGDALFDLVDELDITLMGVSAKFIDALRKEHREPAATHRLDSLRTICSTGSTLVPEGFDYVYEHIKADVHLASISGGTDLCGCLVAGDPTGPVHRGEIQAPGLGQAMAVVDGDGRPVSAGQAGELVCTRPFPSMPLRFWGDPSGDRYHDAYFARFPGMWHQGDFAERTDHGGFVIHGRSDATLNPGGVRIGTAEIYRQVEALPEIAESLVVAQDWDDDTRVVLFVVLAEGASFDDALQSRIRRQVRDNASPRHVPDRILSVPEIPRTRSGKIVELAVRDVIHGRPIDNAEALANPEALDAFRHRPELES
ncbi:MAG: acetoacetate--CoA ligase [Acidimicrobiia bacterium]|nr:acetoacetate--CoA ligase [Acidimicrobiia bacterium]